MSTYGSHPEQMTVKLTLGDGTHLVATSANGWAGPVSLVWGPDGGVWTEETSTLTDPGTVAGNEVSWTLTVAEVTARAAFPYVRLVDNGMTLKAGEVILWSGGLGSTVTQTIASLTAGPPGPSAVSTDPDNVAIISPNDGLIYVSPVAAGGFSDAAVAAFVADEDSDTYASITALQPDLSGYVETTDARLSDARTPTTHATSHASGGSDPVTPASIGAATPAQVSSGDTATLAAAQLHAQGLVDALTAASPATLDTLAEIAAALGEDPNFAATMTAALAARVRHDAAQSLTVSEQSQARSNIGAAPALGADDNYVTDAEKAALHGHANLTALDNVSGVNTGDQDLSGYALTSSLGTAAAADTTDFAPASHTTSTDHDARYVTVVEHGAVAGTARPAGATVVLWIGSVEPTNAVAGDQWDDASGSPSVYYTQDEVDALLADKADVTQAINAQTGTTYTLVAGDAGKLVTLTNGSAITLNAPGSVFTAGQRVDVLVLGAGMATIVGTSGATVNGTPTLVSRAQYSAFTVVWLSATSAVVVGDMAAA